MTAEQTPLLEARKLVKTFGHVTAMRGVDFTVYPGEVVALIGDNGAGKSTLVNVLSGVLAPDSGELLVEGEPVTIDSPADSQRLGISTVFQDLALAPDLDASDNMFLGREVLRGGFLGKFGVLEKRAMRKETESQLKKLGVSLKSSRSPIASYSGGQRQSVAVALAVAWATRMILLDEPTAALGVVQTHNVHELIRRIKAERRIAIVLITHNMPEVLDLADRVEVLRLGERVAQLQIDKTTTDDLVGAMTGSYEEIR